MNSLLEVFFNIQSLVESVLNHELTVRSVHVMENVWEHSHNVRIVLDEFIRKTCSKTYSRRLNRFVPSPRLLF